MKMFGKYLCFFLFLTLFYFTECASTVQSEKRPNVVLIITDDQDSVLGGTTPMKKTQDLIAKKGATFKNSFVSAPICCPSRSSMLTGLYPHNHQTIGNSLDRGCSNATWQLTHEPKTFAAILQSHGYKSFYAGKYLNEYGNHKSGGPEHVPVGWSRWRGLLGNSRYYNFTLSHDGVAKHYFNMEYLTDVVKDMALEFIDEEAANTSPLLMVLAPPAPHDPFTPAPRHENTFNDVFPPITPNFNSPVGKDKHWLMQMQPSPMPAATLHRLDEIYRARWRTLLSVDEMVEEVVNKLEATGLLDNTYVIVTSDNGYHIGQFSQPYDKRQPYETDIRVPLFIRGPGIVAGEILQHPVINVDLAPTILKMAGIEGSFDMDGVAIQPFVEAERTNLSEMMETNEVSLPYSHNRMLLIEYNGEGSQMTSECPWNDTNLFMCLPAFFCKCQDAVNNTYGCVRHVHPTNDFVYCAFNDTLGTEEVYDLVDDPYQLNNIISTTFPFIRYKYRTILEHLQTCKGSNCNDSYEF